MFPGIGDITSDSGSATFERIDGTVNLWTYSDISGFGNCFNRGACTVFHFPTNDETEDAPDPDDFDFTPTTMLDAGPLININGPRGPKTMNMQSKGVYSGDFYSTGFGGGGGNPYLAGGNYNFNNGAGGVDVKGFNFDDQFPDPVNWTNIDERDWAPSHQPFRVTWTGGDQNQGILTIAGFSMNSTTDVGAMFFCQERVSVGFFDIPSWVIDSMPPTTIEQGFPIGSMFLSTSKEPKRFDADGLDVGLENWSSTTLRSFSYHNEVDLNGGGGGNGGNFQLTSSAFANGGVIPPAHAFGNCGGQNLSPPLEWTGVPEGAESFAIVMTDTSANNFVHWAVWDIPVGTTSLAAGAQVGVAGGNDYGTILNPQVGYGGPCPPQGQSHQYQITIYAMNTPAFGIPTGTQAQLVVPALAFSNVGTATLTGKYPQ